VHFFNAFEDGNKIEVYGPAFDRMPGGLQFDSPQQTEQPYPWHWSIDLDAGTVSDGQTDDRSGEFPRINDNLAGLRHRYMYNTMARNWEFGFDFNAVVKYDIETGAAQTYTHGENTVVGEHIFVPNPEGSSEDDGWVLTVASDRLTEKSELVILDAQKLADGPIARVKMPRRVPIGFHANWLPE
jgi:carotenoid cleavage dioxygenase